MIIDAENPNDPSTLHARLIIGIREDCSNSSGDIGNAELIILDPLNPNNGNAVAESLDTSSSKFNIHGGIIMHWAP